MRGGTLMPLTTRIRIFAVILTVGVILFTGGRAPYSTPWETFVYVLAFGHYVIAFLFSKKQLLEAAGKPQGLIKFTALLALGALAYFRQQFPLILYFGIHHAFNEAYLLDRVTKAREEKDVRALRPAASALNFMVYLFLLRHHPDLQFIPVLWMTVGIGVCYGVFGYRFWKASRMMSGPERIDNSAAEFVLIFFLLLSLHTTFKFLYIVAYHFVYWVLRPLPKLFEEGRADVYRYGALTACLFGIAYLASPLGLVAYPMRGSFFFNQFIFLSYLHITLSFALSDFHPRAIVNFFRPA